MRPSLQDDESLRLAALDAAEVADSAGRRVDAMVFRAIALRLENILNELVSAEADTWRLDWLDAVNKRTNERNGTVYGWRYDINHNRAALTDMHSPALTVREAIDTAMHDGKTDNCQSCSGTGRTDNHVTGEVECSACCGTGSAWVSKELGA
jgi:hypothetical protein